jgi:hypothetical protein
MMLFHALPTSFAAGSASRFIRAEPFKPPLLSRLSRERHFIHDLFLSKNEPVNVRENCASGSGETVERVGIGFERVRFTFGVDHGAADEWRKQANVVGRKERPDGVEIFTVERRLIEAAQRHLADFAFRNDAHSAQPIIANFERAPAPFNLDILAKEAAEPFGGYACRLRGSGLIARMPQHREGSFKTFVMGGLSARASRRFIGSGMATRLRSAQPALGGVGNAALVFSLIVPRSGHDSQSFASGGHESPPVSKVAKNQSLSLKRFDAKCESVYAIPAIGNYLG